MSNRIGDNNGDINIHLERARSASDDASQRSNSFRDMAEMALSAPGKILGGIGEVLKSLLGGLSG